MKLFTVLFGVDDRSVFAKLFGSHRKQDAKRQAEADELVKHLVSISRTLLEAIDLLEADLKGLTDDRFFTEASDREAGRGGLRMGRTS
jgi:hypothetical protein